MVLFAFALWLGLPHGAAGMPAFAASTAVASPEQPDARESPDWRGLRRDTSFLLSYQVVAIGFLYAMPESISNWSDEDKEQYTLNKWWRNVRKPQWDDDRFWLNYIAHPYWGGAYYVRARERGYDERASFWYSAAMSAAFEFGAEALFERPSIQDLVVTPVAGVIVGEYFMELRARISSRHAPGEQMSFRNRAVLAVTDPLGAINGLVGSWFGRGGEAHLAPHIGRRAPGERRSYAPDELQTEWVYGLRFDYRW